MTIKATNPQVIIKETHARMQKAFEHTLHEFSTLHTGKASPSMVDSLMVEAYGTMVRIKDVAAITADARTIVIQPWDKGISSAIEKAIRAANVGLNPVADSGIIRCPVPELSGDRRRELVKITNELAEEGRVSIRGARKDGMDALKKMEKDSAITEDDFKRFEKDVQKDTDHFVAEIAKAVEHKEKELMKV